VVPVVRYDSPLQNVNPPWGPAGKTSGLAADPAFHHDHRTHRHRLCQTYRHHQHRGHRVRSQTMWQRQMSQVPARHGELVTGPLMRRTQIWQEVHRLQFLPRHQKRSSSLHSASSLVRRQKRRQMVGAGVAASLQFQRHHRSFRHPSHHHHYPSPWRRRREAVPLLLAYPM
jgi:hypothetical protein